LQGTKPEEKSLNSFEKNPESTGRLQRPDDGVRGKFGKRNPQCENAWAWEKGEEAIQPAPKGPASIKLYLAYEKKPARGV